MFGELIADAEDKGGNAELFEEVDILLTTRRRQKQLSLVGLPIAISMTNQPSCWVTDHSKSIDVSGVNQGNLRVEL